MENSYSISENINYFIVKSQRKSISILIRDGKVTVKAPLRMADGDIHRYVHSKREWIISHYTQPVKHEIELTRSSMMIFGTVYPIILQYGSKVSFELSDHNLMVSYPKGYELSRLNERLEAYLVSLLYQRITQWVKQYTAQFKVDYRSIRMKKYKSTWGKCTSKKDLYFSNKLIYCTLEFIEYVVIHECAHLVHFNHSRIFYDLIRSVMPNYKLIIQENTKHLQTLF